MDYVTVKAKNNKTGNIVSVSFPYPKYKSINNGSIIDAMKQVLGKDYGIQGATPIIK